MLPELFFVGLREHGTRDVLEALYARSNHCSRRRFARKLDPPRENQDGLMIVNDFGRPRPKEGPEVLFHGPKREFVAHHCGDGIKIVMAGGRRACDGVVWVVSAVHPWDDAWVDDVTSAVFCGARSVAVFVTFAGNRALADRCAIRARAALNEVGLRGDERAVIFDTGLDDGDDSTQWKIGIDALIDTLEREVIYPVEPPTPAAFDVWMRGPGGVGGMLKGAELAVGDEVALVRAGITTKIVALNDGIGGPVTRAVAGKMVMAKLDGVDSAAVIAREVVAVPGALTLVETVEVMACDLAAQPIPGVARVRAYVSGDSARIEWLDPPSIRRKPRRARLTFDAPTPWLAGDRGLIEHGAIGNDDDPRYPRWLAAFDHARGE